MYSSIKARALASRGRGVCCQRHRGFTFRERGSGPRTRTIFLFGRRWRVDLRGGVRLGAPHPVGDEGEDEQFEDSDEGEVASVKQYTYQRRRGRRCRGGSSARWRAVPPLEALGDAAALRQAHPEGKELAQSFRHLRRAAEGEQSRVCRVSLLRQVREQVRTGVDLKSRELHSQSAPAEIRLCPRLVVRHHGHARFPMLISRRFLRPYQALNVECIRRALLNDGAQHVLARAPYGVGKTR